MLLVLWIITMVSVRFVAVLLRVPGAHTLPMKFHRGVARLFNLQVTCQGELRTESPVIYVANHVSYLDVFVLGSFLPGSFIAKSEVAGWPVFGKLARLQNTLFFERNQRRAAEQVKTMREYLAGRNNLILFPEGTSTPGAHVEPFRSSLFAAAETVPDGVDDVWIQPVTTAYCDYDGQPMSQAERDYYAWYLPMTFLPHFANAMGLRRAGVKLVFHEPVLMSDFETRKACAQHCENVVRAGLETALSEP